MRNIAILADPLDNQQAGVHTYTKELLAELDKIPSSNTYYVIRHKKTGLYQNLVEISIPHFKWFPLYKAIRLFFLIPRFCRKKQIDIVFEPAHFGPFNLPKSIKRVTFIHDLTPLIFPNFHRFHSQLLQRLFLPWILKRASLVLANSASTKSDIEYFFPITENKVKYIHLAASHEFRPESNHNKPLTHSIQNPFFLFTSTIEPRKNLTLLLRAFNAFKEYSGHEDYNLVIVGGKGWKSRSIFREIDKSPYRKDIILTGYIPVDDLVRLYSLATAFIYPSVYEGFGLPVLEAMQCGAPVIISSTSSLPEVGGKAALYINPHSVQDLLENMRLIGSDISLREQLKQRSTEQSMKFSWEKHSCEFDKQMNEI